ncbi:YceI family protein [Erythrobacter sp.]|uniref:YceI family protein n=1 Tax=Erythrobacter sp. TaxID=1042 RepID=UPI002EC5DF6A|nr:YceI family protein [Erythrobacter sp.]
MSALQNRTLHLLLIALLALLHHSDISANSSAPIGYNLDAGASDVTAKVSFFGLASKTARFPRMEGDVTIVPGAPERARIDVTFDARAIEAPDETTLKRLRGEKFFWVERYPSIRFVGRSLSMSSPTTGTVTGELTARGVTRSETLAVDFASDPSASTGRPVRFSGEMEIDRRDYGMDSYQLIVGNTVDIKLSARMIPR